MRSLGMTQSAAALEPTSQTLPGSKTDAVGGNLRELGKKHARAGVAMAVGTFAMAIGSGIQPVLYLHTFGANGRTDAFFAALAVYAIFGLFGQSIRVTSAPLLVGSRAALTPRRFAATLVLISIPVIVLTWPLAGPF